MLTRALLFSAVLVAATPLPGLAVTLDDVVALSQQGVADTVITAVIDADRTVFTLTPDQVIALKKQGVADAVIVKMLGTAREYGADATATVAPHVVIIGEKPPLPEPAPEPVVVAAPFYVGVPIGPAVRAHRSAQQHSAAPVTRAPVVPVAPTGFGRFINDGWVNGVGFGRFINDGTRHGP